MTKTNLNVMTKTNLNVMTKTNLNVVKCLLGLVLPLERQS